MNRISNSVIGSVRMFGILVLICVAIVFPGYPAKKPESVSGIFESVNLLVNPGFELGWLGEDFGRNWIYYKGEVPAEHGFSSSVVRSGKKSAYVKSMQEGYHGGWQQDIKLLPNTEYKLSGWVKANIVDGKVQYGRCDVYDESHEGYTEKNYHGYIAGSTTKTIDWTYFEKIFRTPDTVRTAQFFPALLWGKGEVWIDDVRIVKLITVEEEKVIFRDNFDKPNLWKLTCHVNGESSAYPKKIGITFSKSDAVKFDGRATAQLHYDFPTKGHDAAIISRKVNIEHASAIKIAVHGNTSWHRLFLVLTDVSGEQHFMSICDEIDWDGWKILYCSLESLLDEPQKYVVEETHYGGDWNQKLDFPITAVTIGLDDRPDSFVGSGNIYIGFIEFVE